jgi:hypothetical protein
MSNGNSFADRVGTKVIVALALVAMVMSGSMAWAGNVLGNRNSVGGISVDARGVVEEPSLENKHKIARLRAEALEKVPAELGEATDLRMISLKGLESAMAELIDDDLGGLARDLPDEMKYLAGLQRVQYVFVYPEENDIVIAGPAEGWKVDELGRIVGEKSGLPVIQLDDLIVALRTADAARTGDGITCSIDPTAEGRRALEQFLSKQRTFTQAVVPGIKDSLGPQNITVTGVPASSRLGRTLVAADYRMKRIAMKLSPTPLPELPSFLDMMQSTRGLTGDVMPRWWMACNYDPIGTTGDGLGWELRGQGVKAMTEDDFIAADGTVSGTGRKNPVAEKWADTMTEKFNDLAVKDPIFGDLRNIMDLCVVSALIQKEDLLTQANASLPLLFAADSPLKIDTWLAPKTVPTQVSYVKRGRSWLITASGGVDVNSWEVAGKTRKDAKVGAVRTKATGGKTDKWWWN